QGLRRGAPARARRRRAGEGAAGFRQGADRALQISARRRVRAGPAAHRDRQGSALPAARDGARAGRTSRGGGAIAPGRHFPTNSANRSQLSSGSAICGLPKRRACILAFTASQDFRSRDAAAAGELVDLSSPTLSARSDAPTAGRAIFSRGVQPGFRSLAVVAGLVLVAIFFLFQALFHQKVLIEQRSRANIWFLAQAEIEYLNFTTALDLYALHDDQITKDALLDRFEIFWSRLPVLLTGKPTEQLRHVEGLVDTISKLIARMEVLEPALSRLH